MRLSIIIVNYNVKHFLIQCLQSIEKACMNIDSEIIVVDNNSVDGSCNEIKEKFPDVNLIQNKENNGFSRANNQAINIAKGEFILLLNPDTVVEEDTFNKCISFMESHEDAGALGVKMIDGKGNFLPESKRALPTPGVAFSKIFGLSTLFPKSKFFGKYHLSYLPQNEINEVEILPGAFMFIRKTVLDKIGLLDEDFFMYGEDIDLSYRIVKANYKNYYFPDTTIIHYKGESTKKGSLNYVLIFYRAMIIFAKKHFSKKNAKLFSGLINIAIYLRASLSLLKRFVSNFFLPFLDAVSIFLGYFFVLPYWEQYKFQGEYGYPDIFIKYVVPGYVLIWVFMNYILGAYEKPVKLLKLFRGITFGTIIILVAYAMLPENLRFSRALILIGTSWAIFVSLIIRVILNASGIKKFKLSSKRKVRIGIIGSVEEATRIKNLINQTENKTEIVGFISVKHQVSNPEFLGSIDQLNEILKINNIDEIIFCAKDISSSQIIRFMLDLTDKKVDYKIAPPETMSVIGSNSINAAGELYVINVNSIAKESNTGNNVFYIILKGIKKFIIKK